uniref:Uncharacterized protein n=1 Tax=Rhizophora mucronata TaxID=61149 RepID=A0A2P2QKF5_RHIMU
MALQLVLNTLILLQSQCLGD